MTEPTDTPPAKPPMGMLERRGIEAAILKPVYEEMAARLGEAVAQEILGAAITRAAVESAAAFAATEPNGTSLTSFADLQPLWTKDDALRLEVLHQDETRFELQRHPLPLRRDVPGDGAGSHRPSAVLQPNTEVVPVSRTVG